MGPNRGGVRERVKIGRKIALIGFACHMTNT